MKKFFRVAVLLLLGGVCSLGLSRAYGSFSSVLHQMDEQCDEAFRMGDRQLYNERALLLNHNRNNTLRFGIVARLEGISERQVIADQADFEKSLQQLRGSHQ